MTAITTALVFLVLMAFVAVAINLGSLFWDRQQGQNGADSAALALAQTCAKTTAANCGGTVTAAMQTMATQYVRGSKTDANSNWTSITLGVTCSGATKANTVTVRVETTRDRLVPGVGAGTDTTGTCATAAWGGIGSATVLPLTISGCQAPDKTAGGEIIFRWHLDTTDCVVGNPPHNLPSGFGWLEYDSTCHTVTSADHWVNTSPGNNAPNSAACDALLTGLQGKSILIPLFDDLTGTGAGVKYHVYAYAQVRITTYCLDSKLMYDTPLPAGIKNCPADRWIAGTFEKKVELDATVGGPDLGVTTIQLTD